MSGKLRLFSEASIFLVTYPSRRLQVNCMASPLLALRLLPHMMRTAKEYASKPRIVILSSDIHHRAQVGETEVNSEHLLELLSSEEYCSEYVLQHDAF